jgi:hypothetical protein
MSGHGDSTNLDTLATSAPPPSNGQSLSYEKFCEITGRPPPSLRLLYQQLAAQTSRQSIDASRVPDSHSQDGCVPFNTLFV